MSNLKLRFLERFTYIGDTLATLDLVFHPGEGVVIRSDVGDDGFLVWPSGVHVLRVQQSRYTELGISHVERVIKIVDILILLHFRPIDQVWSVGMNEGIETKTAPPGTCNEPSRVQTSNRF